MTRFIKFLIWPGIIFSAVAIAEVASPGRDLYFTAGGYGCGVCHGPVANGGGQAGGPIRGATLEDLNKALVEQPTMQLLVNELSQSNIADLSRYLESLAQIPLMEMVYTDMGWRITRQPVGKGQTVQMIVYNDSFVDLPLNLHDFGFAPTTVIPLDTVVLEWTAMTGAYRLPDNELLIVQ